MKEYLGKKLDSFLAGFAFMFAEMSMQRICFAIYHQPKVPQELLK